MDNLVEDIRRSNGKKYRQGSWYFVNKILPQRRKRRSDFENHLYCSKFNMSDDLIVNKIYKGETLSVSEF